MDNESDPTRLELTPLQLKILHTVQMTEAAKILQIKFTRPEDDNENIRQRIYIQGGLDVLRYLLEFDNKANEEAEAIKREQLDREANIQFPDASLNQLRF